MARIRYHERHGVLQPFVQCAVRIVGSRGQRVLAWAEIAAERKHNSQDLPRLARSELELLEFRVGSVDLEPNARANHDPHHGVIDRVAILHRHPHESRLAAGPRHGGVALCVERFDCQQSRAPIPPPERRGQQCAPRRAQCADAPRHVGAVFFENLAGVAFGRQMAAVQPPKFIGGRTQQVFLMRNQQSRGPRPHQAHQFERSLSPPDGIASSQRVVEQKQRHGREVQRIRGPQQAADCGPIHRALRRLFQSSRQAQEFPRAAAVFAKDADDRAIGRRNAQSVERRERHVAKRDRHAR